MGASSPSDSSSERKLDSTTPLNDSRRPWHDEENPFIAFRRYADEQISSMLQSVMGLPSMASTSFLDRWFDTDLQKYRDWTRQRESDGSTSTSDDRSACACERRCPHGRAGWCPRDDWPWGFGPRRLDELFDSFFDDHFPFGPRRFPFFFDWFGMSHDSETWAIPYILFSPYSPLHLEQSRGDRRRGVFSSLFSSMQNRAEIKDEPNWRDAFEDLLRIENGQPMLERSKDHDSRNESGRDWLRGLVQRESLGKGWKLITDNNSDGNSPWHFAIEKSGARENGERSKEQSKDNTRENAERHEPQTELDLYDRFLQDIFEAHERDYSRMFEDSPLMRMLAEERKRHLERWKEATEKWKQMETGRSEDWLEYSSESNQRLLKAEESNNNNASTPSEPSVISTMTRTERRTLPDGSIRTKTIKTKRFSDGREESDESEEVHHPQPLLPPTQNESNTQSSPPEAQNEPNGKSSKGGWFWSR
ncbi:hypothetical protein VTN49DRAFT_5189 [Thermomyces lanuginosus]|uniref:uncharacterized protein n=1 Tax=Thermomyces lanuginosus TaxID=5541 RepID=UPI003743A9D7